MKFSVNRIVAIGITCVLAAGCAKTGAAPAPPQGLPDSPDGTVKVIAENLVNHQPEIIWQALPESYRNDIVELTGTFAEKMDPVLYDRTLAVIGRAVEVLAEKKPIILESQTAVMSGVDRERLDQGMGSSLVMAQTLLGSEISTIAGLQAINWETFLETTGSELLKQAEAIKSEDGDDPLADLATLQVEVIEKTDDTAKLRLTIEGEEPEVVDVVRLEGRWVPAELASEWPQMMADARKDLDEIDQEKMDEMKGQALMGLAMAEGLIEQVATVQTAEEFDALIGPMIQAMMGSMGSMMEEDEDYGGDEG